MKAEWEIDPTALKKIAETSPKLDQMARRRAEEGVALAKAIFEAQQRRDNEWRLSETTPPKYMNEFFVHRVGNGQYHYGNSDPAWAWVEYGAHAGGETPVLRYRPLGRSLDALAGG